MLYTFYFYDPPEVTEMADEREVNDLTEAAIEFEMQPKMELNSEPELDSAMEPDATSETEPQQGSDEGSVMVFDTETAMEFETESDTEVEPDPAVVIESAPEAIPVGEPEEVTAFEPVTDAVAEPETASVAEPEDDLNMDFTSEQEAEPEIQQIMESEVEPETEPEIKAKRKPEKKEESRTGFQKFLRIWNGFWKWIFHLRSVGFAIPIAIIAILLAMHNKANLPEQVGLNIQSTGAYEQMVDREVAVYAPLALTGICLFLMLCSRKVLYPLLISIFSLALPILIWITNTFPN